ncbi:MAG: tripartite tricarboxylate transporter TctB family protein [Geminicoccaceae bacterium]|nr:MAG: tripartite tricarboxylate transporter TctB family protein [Geminicoccaceae bacterium]
MTSNRFRLGANQVLALVLAVFAVWYLNEAFQIRRFPLPRPVDSDLFPKVLGWLLLGLSALLFLTKNADTRPSEPATGRPWLEVLLTALAIALYAWALRPLGFVLASALLVAGLAVLYGYRQWWILATVAIGLPLLFYLALTRLMAINLPAGLLPF